MKNVYFKYCNFYFNITICSWPSWIFSIWFGAVTFIINAKHRKDALNISIYLNECFCKNAGNLLTNCMSLKMTILFKNISYWHNLKKHDFLSNRSKTEQNRNTNHLIFSQFYSNILYKRHLFQLFHGQTWNQREREGSHLQECCVKGPSQSAWQL